VKLGGRLFFLLENINLKKKRFTLAHGFRTFCPWSLGSIVPGPVVRQSITVERMWWSRAACLMAAEKPKLIFCRIIFSNF
jgi:hypothetical protein